MIRIVKIEADTPDKRVCTLFADTKTEVPTYGKDTIDLAGPLGAGSVIYTADLDIGVLNSSDEWVWH